MMTAYFTAVTVLFFVLVVAHAVASIASMRLAWSEREIFQSPG